MNVILKLSIIVLLCCGATRALDATTAPATRPARGDMLVVSSVVNAPAE